MIIMQTEKRGSHDIFFSVLLRRKMAAFQTLFRCSRAPSFRLPTCHYYWQSDTSHCSAFGYLLLFSAHNPILSFCNLLNWPVSVFPLLFHCDQRQDSQSPSNSGSDEDSPTLRTRCCLCLTGLFLWCRHSGSDNCCLDSPNSADSSES